MIRIGPAGIPLSCKGRTLKDGIIYTKSLELDSLEVQFVRGIRMTEEDAAEVGEVAEEAQVELHVHAPYYTNLAGDERNLQLTREKVLKAANLANIMGAKTVVVHPGFYGELTPEEATERIAEVVTDLRDEFRKNKWTPKIGLVTMGKRAVFGSLDEIVAVCRQVEGIVPVIDFSHIHARGNGSLNTVEDFQDVFDKLIPLGLDHYLIHFTGVAYENGNERHHLPIKKGDLRFEPLVEVILENDYNVTLISTSPILEHDAMYMQIVLDRVKEKREQRLQKELQKQKEDEEAALRAELEGDDDTEDTPPAKEEKPAAAPEPKPKPEPRPQCAAFTQAGNPCSNPARTGSKYCSSHKGYRPKPAKKEAPAKKAASKKPASDKGGKKSSSGSAGSGSTTKKTEPNKTAKKAPAKKATKKAPAKKTAAKAAKKAPVKKAAKKATKKANGSSTGNKSPAKKATKQASRPVAATESPSLDSPQNGSKGVGGRIKNAAKRLVGRKK